MVLWFGGVLFAVVPLSVLLSTDGTGLHDRIAGNRVIRIGAASDRA
jgi:uncharacterized RDD family membrane protein YckC